MSNAGSWMKDHKKELEIGAGVLGVGLTGGLLMPALAGSGAAGGAAAAGAADAAAQPATSGIASGLLQTLGHMGPEQANILAAQDAAFGLQTPGATLQTLAAANPTINAALGQHGVVAPLLKGIGVAQKAMGAQQQPQPMAMSRPPSMGQQAAPQSSAQILASQPIPQAQINGAMPPGSASPEQMAMLLELLKKRGMA